MYERRYLNKNLAQYARHGQAYSGEQNDLILMLANHLAERERRAVRDGGSPYGHTREDIARATKIVRRMRQMHTMPRRSR